MSIINANVVGRDWGHHEWCAGGSYYAINPPCEGLVVGRDWGHHEWCDGGSYCAINQPCKGTVVGRDWGHREWCDGGSYCALNPPCKESESWWRIGSTTRSLRIDVHGASNLALHQNHHIQKQHILLRHYALIFAVLPISPYTQIAMSKNNKYFQVPTHWYSQCFQSRPTPKSPCPKTTHTSTSLLL